MRKRFAKLPSPALAVAFVALLAALTGTAVALPGSNTVTSGDIKTGGVTSSDIKNSTVRGKDVRNNTLTGSDVSEGSLGTVPSASSAAAANIANLANFAGNAGATDGQSLAKIRYNGAADSAPVTVLNFGGLVLTATCDTGTLALTANPTTGDAFLHSFGDNTLNLDTDDFNPGDDVDIFETGNADSSTVTVVFASASGNVVTLNLSGEEDGGTPTDPACSVYGTAVGS